MHHMVQWVYMVQWVVGLQCEALVHSRLALCGVCTVQWVVGLRPKVFAIQENDASFSSPFFLARFSEVLRTGQASLDFADHSIHNLGEHFAALGLEQHMVLDLINCVARDGLARHQRAESAARWSERVRAFPLKSVPVEGPRLARLEIEAGKRGFNLAPVGSCLAVRWQEWPFFYTGAWTVAD